MRTSRLLAAQVRRTIRRGFISHADHYKSNTRSFRPSQDETSSTASSPRIYRHHLSRGELFRFFEGQYECVAEPMWLRLACSCDKCVDPSDGQMNFSHAYIPADIAVKSHERDHHGNYFVKWTNDVPGFDSDHISVYTPGQIANSTAASTHPRKTLLARPQQLWNRGYFDIEHATLSYNEYMDSREGLALALHHLSQKGLVFIKDVPPDGGSVANLAQRIGLLRNTFYGSTWDVRSKPDAENVAYTSRFLGFHMDLLYMKEPPGLQLLHCIENTCEGGESAFVDTFQALHQLLEQNPVAFQLLRDIRNDYGYTTGGYSYFDTKPVISDGKSIHTRSKQTAEGVALPGNHTLNAVERVYWSPPFVKKTFLSTNYPKPRVQSEQRAQRLFADILERQDLRVETKLPAGTCAIFDNLRVVHARNAFNTNSGHRWLRGAYLDFQDFFSKAQELEPLMPSLETQPRLTKYGR